MWSRVIFYPSSQLHGDPAPHPAVESSTEFRRQSSLVPESTSSCILFIWLPDPRARAPDSLAWQGLEAFSGLLAPYPWLIILLPHLGPDTLLLWSFQGWGCVFPKRFMGSCFPGLICMGLGYLSHPLRCFLVLLASLHSLQGCLSWSNVVELQIEEDPQCSHIPHLCHFLHSIPDRWLPTNVLGIEWLLRCLWDWETHFPRGHPSPLLDSPTY